MPCLRFLRMLGCPRSPRTAIHGTVPPSASCTISTSAPGPPPPGPSAGVSGPSRRSALLHRSRRVSLSGVHHRPGGHRSGGPGGASPWPRPGRGPHPLRQGVGAAQPALPRLRRQRSLAGAGARRPGPGRLDAAPLPRRRGRQWEPKRLRYCLLHVAARLVRSGRRLYLRLQCRWPWTRLLGSAFERLRSLPAA